MRKAWTWLAESFRKTSYGGYLAIVRILVGYHFVEVAWIKLSGNFFTGSTVQEYLADAAKDPLAFHREFILDFVAPHPVFISYLVAFGEMAIGISLVTGCLVRIASSFGAFHNFNILFAIAIPSANPLQVRVNRLFIFLHLLFVIAAAGRSLGVDGWLKQKFPRSRLF
ncbi:MAG: hypothetical protein A3H28_13790 [Acidobacteria bacterium RIFCSPLOWO2_02_FULL_61_28]|nr:MAG: hypothetical protein A3H28_13790 [Acidobacteria bacterium RIFCSPLOWO2_02_FULL_61_28]